MKSVRFGESDLILQCLSVQGEKKGFLARGAMKSRKRFGGGLLEPSHLVELTFSPPRSEAHLNIVQEARLIDDFGGMRKSYEKLQLGLFILDYTRRVSQEGDTHSDTLFNLLGFTLKLLATEEHPNLSFLKTQFLLKVLHHQGVLSLKSWMIPFLKFKISDHTDLKEVIFSNISMKYILHENFMEVENIANNYVRRAEMDEDSGCKFSTVSAR